MTTLTITLRDEDRRFIESALLNGHYSSASEAVSDAIAQLRVRETLREARIAKVRAEVIAGIELLERGEGAVWDVDGTKSHGRGMTPRQSAA